MIKCCPCSYPASILISITGRYRFAHRMITFRYRFTYNIGPISARNWYFAFIYWSNIYPTCLLYRPDLGPLSFCLSDNISRMSFKYSLVQYISQILVNLFLGKIFNLHSRIIYNPQNCTQRMFIKWTPTFLIETLMFVVKTNYEHNKKVKDVMCMHLPEFCNKETNYLRNAVSLQ